MSLQIQWCGIYAVPSSNDEAFHMFLIKSEDFRLDTWKNDLAMSLKFIAFMCDCKWCNKRRSRCWRFQAFMIRNFYTLRLKSQKYESKHTTFYVFLYIQPNPWSNPLSSVSNKLYTIHKISSASWSIRSNMNRFFEETEGVCWITRRE